MDKILKRLVLHKDLQGAVDANAFLYASSWVEGYNAHIGEMYRSGLAQHCVDRDMWVKRALTAERRLNEKSDCGRVLPSLMATAVSRFECAAALANRAPIAALSLLYDSARFRADAHASGQGVP